VGLVDDVGEVRIEADRRLHAGAFLAAGAHVGEHPRPGVPHGVAHGVARAGGQRAPLDGIAAAACAYRSSARNSTYAYTRDVDPLQPDPVLPAVPVGVGIHGLVATHELLSVSYWSTTSNMPVAPASRVRTIQSANRAIAGRVRQ